MPSLFLIKDNDQAARLLARLEAGHRTEQYRIDSEAYAVQYEDQAEVTVVGRMDYYNMEGWG